jgi:pimeloyl-ACP methyl ester carboxylesterase
MTAADIAALPELPLPPSIRARRVAGINGLDLHVLEAGDAGRPCVLLLHGFPELAYSWRKLMPSLADAGYHVLAPDQRGYGRTTGWDADYDADLRPFGLLNLAQDALALVAALGHRKVAAVVGHDFGAPVAAWCALWRPDVFRALVLMSAPFGGPPQVSDGGEPLPQSDIHTALAALPRPRKHYQEYYRTRQANAEMWHCAQGVHDFLRAYYHMKSADWPGNRPVELQDWRADELARMPTYYVMDRDQGMADTVAAHMPTRAQVAGCEWLTQAELAVYAAEYERTGFQGGLQWYRCSTHPPCVAELQRHAGRTIDVPACFIAGASDWGVYQKPGELQRMHRSACTRLRGMHRVVGAGHWVQQEQPGATAGLLLDFLASVGQGRSAR